MPSELLTERRGTTLVLTISDPPTRNTLSAQVIAAGIEALGVAEADPEVRCVVLQGAGGHFCAGGNVQGLVERRAAGEAAQRRMLDHLHHWIETMASYPKPIVAAVEGAAAGAGFSLALACDLVVAASDARFVMSHAQARPVARRRRDRAPRRGAAAGARQAAAVARRAGVDRDAERPRPGRRWSACPAARSPTR